MKLFPDALISLCIIIIISTLQNYSPFQESPNQNIAENSKSEIRCY